MMRCHFHRVVRLGALAALVAVGGCASVSPPPKDIATRHVGAPGAFAEGSLDSAVLPEEVSAGWLAGLNDPRLDELVREAWAHNPDLYVAAARFEEAAASLRVAASYLAPNLNGTAGASYTDSNDTSDGDAYSVGLGVSWEADLWGRLRLDRAASRSVASAAGLDYLQARHSLAAAVAKAYYALVTAKQQLTLDRQLLDAERFTATTTRQRVDAGIGTALDDDLAESSVRLAEASVQQDLAALREAGRALEVLLGRYPSAELDAAPDELPPLPAGPLAVGVPAALLERRPDIRSAEQSVNAAYYSVKAAQAAKLPRLTLSADGTQSLDPSDFISSVAAGMLAPLYQGGLLNAQEAAATARQRQALGGFASVALNAFNEVESALSNDRFLRAREQSLAAASERLTRASDIAISRYEQGLMTILDLQQIRRTDYSTRSLLLSVRYEQISQRLNLHLALGGPVLGDEDASITESQEMLLERRPASPTGSFTSGTLRVGTEPHTTTRPSRGPEDRDGD